MKKKKQKSKSSKKNGLKVITGSNTLLPKKVTDKAKALMDRAAEIAGIKKKLKKRKCK